tara:strand:- start:852 stop:1037 length:186 start_codon:yes stop_codon:yes gene_type:complete
MTRKTKEELQKELKSLQNSFERAVQIQNECRERAIAINAILEDRKQAESEKKPDGTVSLKD